MYVDEIPSEANDIVEYTRNHPQEAVDKIGELQAENFKLKKALDGCSKCKDQYEAEVKRLNQLVFAYESAKAPVNPHLRDKICKILITTQFNHWVAKEHGPSITETAEQANSRIERACNYYLGMTEKGTILPYEQTAFQHIIWVQMAIIEQALKENDKS